MHGAIDEATGPGAAPRAGPEDRIARLRLMRTPTVGPVTYAQLLDRFGTAAAALEAVPDLARRGGGKSPVVPARAAIEREVEAGRAGAGRPPGAGHGRCAQCVRLGLPLRARAGGGAGRAGRQHRVRPRAWY